VSYVEDARCLKVKECLKTWQGARLNACIISICTKYFQPFCYQHFGR